jgi:hypothetical protein
LLSARACAARRLEDDGERGADRYGEVGVGESWAIA